jgi:predicted CXXCH cytochrome family protein
MKPALTIFLFLTFAILPLKAAPGDAKAGQAAFTKSCGSCHSPDGSPKEAVAKMLKVEMKNLAAKEVQEKTDDQLRKEVMEGTGKMKPVKGLTDKQAGDIVAFLRTLKK